MPKLSNLRFYEADRLIFWMTEMHFHTNAPNFLLITLWIIFIKIIISDKQKLLLQICFEVNKNFKEKIIKHLVF